MKIGIIFYTLSRHTLALSREIKRMLEQEGHLVEAVQLEPASYQVRAQKSELKSIPSVSGYDLLILACPVHGGRMAPPMQAFIENTVSLKNKKVACFITQVFPRKWGGEQTLAAMRTVCESKGARVIASGGVSWYSFARRRQIQAIIGDLKAAIK